MKSLQARPNLCKSVTPTFSYNSTQPLTALGKLNAHIQHDNQSIQAEYVVMKGTSGNLLDFATSQKLKIVKINSVETIETNLNVNNTGKINSLLSFREKLESLKIFS
jgi:hypothetical protein